MHSSWRVECVCVCVSAVVEVLYGGWSVCVCVSAVVEVLYGGWSVCVCVSAVMEARYGGWSVCVCLGCNGAGSIWRVAMSWIIKRRGGSLGVVVTQSVAFLPLPSTIHDITTPSLPPISVALVGSKHLRPYFDRHAFSCRGRSIIHTL